MANYAPINTTEFLHRRWRRAEGYAFAANDSLVPLLAHEVSRACMHWPLAFCAQGQGYVPVALLGLQPQQNLFVLPNGRWLGAYVPAQYRAYPFALRLYREGKKVLCVDMDSGLVNDTEGDAFFDTQGQLAAPVKPVLDFLQQLENGQVQTQRQCSALMAEQLVVPWDLRVKQETGQYRVEGLYRIDEERLNQLDGDALVRLRQAGALALVHAQLLSMQHVQRLSTLAQAYQKLSERAAAEGVRPGPAELDLEFLQQDGLLRFGGH